MKDRSLSSAPRVSWRLASERRATRWVAVANCTRWRPGTHGSRARLRGVVPVPGGPSRITPSRPWKLLDHDLLDRPLEGEIELLERLGSREPSRLDPALAAVAVPSDRARARHRRTGRCSPSRVRRREHWPILDVPRLLLRTRRGLSRRRHAVRYKYTPRGMRPRNHVASQPARARSDAYPTTAPAIAPATRSSVHVPRFPRRAGACSRETGRSRHRFAAGRHGALPLSGPWA